ncbi:gamma-glutamyl-gamma-aminobutyrate hydrolase family protein [Acetobacter fallax]|uniref:Gamma-glutamyl-gamma-aminobutyrate hydrolase family protein n=1 Tax=Acetobacter fallax TaxID=1737473 RepID=A0ABX0KDV5_9PROT|nr:gamma-glutamyl-gamma-aminobutyrate hydrolase family protein [Acetobacter fallax]NHO33777.1 gamma-glutamyl-gamma-aminobutyrate hydrolase family protein [Acetobacter fallax]NHO37338.1 gamma-glutamyl-gamma-aminobutyrate hydrolase family protein [Acetobacter fallax]
MTASLPLIGVTLDQEPGGPGQYSAFPWYAVRANYMSAVVKAGGLPVALSHMPCLAAEVVSRLDGLVVTGGAFDIDPALYGEARDERTPLLKPGRTQAELKLIEAARARGIPVFGICGGMQLLAAVLGGTLYQDIEVAIPGALPHEQPNPRDEAGHCVSVVPGTRLAGIVGRASMAVNSSHHQAVRDPGQAVVSARAEDGVIEAIEDSEAVFCIGVQWHPEFSIDPGDRALFAAFVAAARG